MEIAISVFTVQKKKKKKAKNKRLVLCRILICRSGARWKYKLILQHFELFLPHAFHLQFKHQAGGTNYQRIRLVLVRVAETIIFHVNRTATEISVKVERLNEMSVT